ncbi:MULTISPECIES: YheT family hydrolase [Moraxella]|uniref:Alpha/beta hydrolase n=1 Tax=Moraxella lacunata TaxID=477 RepID=A0A1B8PY47_MORLA|nr:MULTISPECIES: alpha/beta fold hydrolase [Moraxella]MBE9579688.1 alpha/beta fold hydrolase [Moraxella sp. K1664]MBE9588397.1 alpha/beta fold hydrolase [Moraxella sp. K1630]MBE9596578.1 alpha/beta fold hydrolase [Moraxella sp. K2450]MDH9219042.1 alpha/beta fold hydrolase [Moraxella lacunata]MDI4484083.1 alpha/beta hydrolase [Moraxella lacunata]
MTALATDFRPPLWLKNPHLQTILPRYVVKYTPDYTRHLIKDSLDESQVAFDYLLTDDTKVDGKYQKPLIVLFHGMEGSSQSHYAKSLARAVHGADCHFVVAHFRSCGGVAVSGKVFYNAGDTAEVHHNLTHLQNEFAHIYAVGVSLGGNALAKYMGEYGSDAIPARAVVVSAPVDLASSSVAMERLLGRHIYTPYLLNPIVKKALENRLTPDELKALKSAKRIGDFDNVFTAPRHGFRSKNDYYRQSSALPYLADITKPTLIITAKDDPFLGVTAERSDVSADVELLDTTYGGHIGFMNYDYRTRSFDTGFIGRQVVGFLGVSS